jgi:hypothetical protein
VGCVLWRARWGACCGARGGVRAVARAVGCVLWRARWGARGGVRAASHNPIMSSVYVMHYLMQAGDRGFNDFLSRRFTANEETERIHDEMCQQIEDVLVRAQEAGEVRADITQADIVNPVPRESGE